MSIPISQSNFFKHLLPPHSGYHWDRSSRRFFEGWYYRVTLPDCGQTFAFMYSIEDPVGGKPHSGGAAQILGPNDEYLCRTFPDVRTFWAWRQALGLGHWSTLPGQDLESREQRAEGESQKAARIARNQGNPVQDFQFKSQT
ncbi:MAG: tocopherol cyclase family protein, partial [Kovacikia sp.]